MMIINNTPEEDAKKIIAEFTRALEESKKGSAMHDLQDLFIVHSNKSMRTPQEHEEKSDGHKEEREQKEQKEFISIFFSNAPRVHNNCILMEKKQW
jgi:hypothetical protein